MSGRRIRPSTHRIRRENELIRQRDKEFRYEQLWNNQNEYYKHWEKNNSKFEEWTSPRYYKSNNHLMQQRKEQRDKEENLEKRRDKLRKLFEQEGNLYEVEVAAKKLKDKLSTPSRDGNPIKEVSGIINLDEDDRKRHEAELNLYHKWRKKKMDPEKPTKAEDIKLSWLDQQIETRMKKEKEGKEKQRTIKLRKQQLKEEKEIKENALQNLEEKKQDLQGQLDDYLKLLSGKEDDSKSLKQQENEWTRNKARLESIEEIWKDEQKRRSNAESSLNKFKSYKVKMQQKTLNIEGNLDKEEQIIKQLKDVKLPEESLKTLEIEQVLEEFLIVISQQKQLEKKRLNKFSFVFNSEERHMFQQQSLLWNQEENARKILIDDVLNSLKNELNRELDKNKRQQIELVNAREEILQKVEEFCGEIKVLEKEERKLSEEIQKMSRDI